MERVQEKVVERQKAVEVPVEKVVEKAVERVQEKIVEVPHVIRDLMMDRAGCDGKHNCPNPWGPTSPWVPEAL